MADFPFKLEPSDKILFASSTLGDVCCPALLKVYNTTKDYHAFKIKCTSNDFFRLRPPVTLIPPGEDPIIITIVFNAGKQIPDNRKHFFAVYGLQCNSTDSARAVFASNKIKQITTKKLYAEFKKLQSDNDKKQDEKDEKKED